VTYKLQLPVDNVVQPVFHVSQVKQFTLDHSLVYSQLPHVPLLDIADVSMECILDRSLVKKGNEAITHILVQWTGLPTTLATWEDYSLLLNRFRREAMELESRRCHHPRGFL
jgi:hypothetical protein